MPFEKTSSTFALEIQAAIEMRPATQLPMDKPLTAGWGPVIFFHDKCYPGRVLICEKPIAPAAAGEATIGVMATDAAALGFRVGSPFELRDGPSTVIATATVQSLKFV